MAILAKHTDQYAHNDLRQDLTQQQRQPPPKPLLALYREHVKPHLSTLIVYEDKRILLQPSIDYALYNPSFVNPDGMFKLADQRMYAAKRRQLMPKHV